MKSPTDQGSSAHHRSVHNPLSDDPLRRPLNIERLIASTNQYKDLHIVKSVSKEMEVDHLNTLMIEIVALLPSSNWLQVQA